MSTPNHGGVHAPPPPASMCEGKAAFRSYRYARRRMHQPWQNFDAGMTAYLCAYCHQWHVGHTDEVESNKPKHKGKQQLPARETTVPRRLDERDTSD